MTPIYRSGRLSQFGIPQRQPAKRRITEDVIPEMGFTEISDRRAPPGSLVSSENVWVRPGKWEPRYGIKQVGSANTLADEGNGTLTFDDVGGGRWPVITSKSTVAYLDGATWTALTYASGTSNLPPSGEETDTFFGDSVYLPRIDQNVLGFTNGMDPIFVWDGPSNSTGYSTLTGAPICKDLVRFDNRFVCWHTADLSSYSRLVQRVQWPVRGDVEDWTGIGAGFEDLLDARGEGTRIFAEEDEMILFTTSEMWRGRKAGLPFVFQFSPINREVGLPYERAAVKTEDGIFWLGGDLMVWHFFRGQLTPVGKPIQRELRKDLVSPELAFLTWNPNLRHISVWYSTTQSSAPDRNWTIDIDTGQWTPHNYPMRFTAGSASFPDTPSAATTWAQLVGAVSAQALTYNELLGGSGVERFEGLLSSAGTAYVSLPSATSDDGTAIDREIMVMALREQPQHIKFMDIARLDVLSTANSQISVAFSTDMGRTFPSEEQITIAGNSQTSQYIYRPGGVAGTYPAVRIQSSSNSTWEISGLQVEAQLRGPTV